MLRTRAETFGKFHGWRISVLPARSIATPAASGNNLVFGGGFGSHEVYCVDVRSGDKVWETRLRDDGPTAATIIDGTVFLNTESCTLDAIDVASGVLKWERWLGDPLLAQPAAAGGRVFMVWPAGGRHRLGAFTTDLGAPLWEAELDADTITAPITDGKCVYVATFDGAVSSFDVRSGKRKWTRDMRATSAPWIMDDDVFVAHRQKHQARRWATMGLAGVEEHVLRERIARMKSASGHDVSAFVPKGAPYLSPRHGASRKAAFAREDAAVGFGHAPAAAKMRFAHALIGESHVSRAWRYQGSRPVVAGGVLFEAAGDVLSATNIALGKILWTWSDAVAMEGERLLTPPVVANGRVLFGTWDGRIVSLNSANGRERWSVDVGAPVHWQPGMYDGRVFAGLENGSVVCFATGDDGDDDWPMWGGGPGHNGPKARTHHLAGRAAAAAAHGLSSARRPASIQREEQDGRTGQTLVSPNRDVDGDLDAPQQGLLLLDYGRSPEGLPRIDTSDLFPDPWRLRLYTETLRSLPLGARLTIEGAQCLVDSLCRRFDRTAISVQASRLPMPAFEFDERTGKGLRLLFPTTRDNALMANEHFVLHEICHHFAVSTFQRETHGPLFLGYLLLSAAEHFGRDLDGWHDALAQAGLHAFTPGQLTAIRSITNERPLDVEEFVGALDAIPDIAHEIRTYYQELPPSRVLAERVTHLYAKHGVPPQVSM